MDVVYSGEVRRVALLLVMTLVGPSIATAVCELACVHHAHHAATNPSPSRSMDCHGHDSDAERRSVDSAGWPCHDAAGDVAVLVEAARQQIADRDARELPALLSATSGGDVSTHAGRFRPPDVLLITTQLRI